MDNENFVNSENEALNDVDFDAKMEPKIKSNQEQSMEPYAELNTEPYAELNTEPNAELNAESKAELNAGVHHEMKRDPGVEQNLENNIENNTGYRFNIDSINADNQNILEPDTKYSNAANTNVQREFTHSYAQTYSNQNTIVGNGAPMGNSASTGNPNSFGSSTEFFQQGYQNYLNRYDNVVQRDAIKGDDTWRVELTPDISPYQPTQAGNPAHSMKPGQTVQPVQPMQSMQHNQTQQNNQTYQQPSPQSTQQTVQQSMQSQPFQQQAPYTQHPLYQQTIMQNQPQMEMEYQQPVHPASSPEQNYSMQQTTQMEHNYTPQQLMQSEQGYSQQQQQQQQTAQQQQQQQQTAQQQQQTAQQSMSTMQLYPVSTSAQQNYDPPIHQLYTESIKKRERRRKRKSSFWKYALVSFSGAVIGVAVMFLTLRFLMPTLAPKLFSTEPTEPRSITEIIRQYEISSIDSPIEAIYEKVSPTIVGIRITSSYNDFFFGQQDAKGEGSGIIIREDGYILTNNHVIAAEMSGGFFPSPGNSTEQSPSNAKIEVILPDNKEKAYPATLVGRDSKTDLAVLKIDAANLPAAELGDSDLLKPGELVVAIGNPGGLEYMSSVTDGIVSGLNRTVRTEDGKEFSLIQTNAAINPGNSGGALVNAKGQVIGINTIKVAATGYEGLGFAIPINSAKEVANNLIDFNYVKGRAKIGILYQKDFNDNYDYYKKQYKDIPKGVFVAEVEPLSGAFKAGIKAGDIITKMNGVVIEDYNKLIEIRDTLKPGDKIPVEVYRDGETLKLEMELSEDIGDYQN